MKHVYTLDDLSTAAFPQAMPHAKLAVIGYPIKHSASPQMHQAALDQAGYPHQYIRVEVEPGKVHQCFERMEALGFIGCNVTVPHKLEAMELCDTLTEDAIALGATNTIQFSEGKRIGHNTDGPGLERAILEDFGKPLSALRVLLLGAGGGAGRAIATQCARLGTPELFLSNRTISKIEGIASDLREYAPGSQIHTISNDDASLLEAACKADLIINSTSLGLKPNDPLPIPASALEARHLVYDAIYSPAVTPLLESAAKREAQTANGLSMLLHQGALAYEFWLGSAADTGAMRRGLGL
ncbi:shikimate dehydrogenase [Rubritalea marina]|uniref:shikimate dehydrogenase n=1 Tax=Rubritalea marina TaxID=361055 RepID=UPI00036A9CAF|nr:shikimate dehydrogenase [Rubritalea marina]